MPFSIEDKHTIKVLRQNNGYGAVHLLKMFPTKPCTFNGLKTLIWKIDDCGSGSGSGWPRTVRVADVEDLVLNQDNDPSSLCCR